MPSRSCALESGRFPANQEDARIITQAAAVGKGTLFLYRPPADNRRKPLRIPRLERVSFWSAARFAPVAERSARRATARGECDRTPATQASAFVLTTPAINPRARMSSPMTCMPEAPRNAAEIRQFQLFLQISNLCTCPPFKPLYSTVLPFTHRGQSPRFSQNLPCLLGDARHSEPPENSQKECTSTARRLGNDHRN